MSKGGKSGGSTTTVQKADPWSGVQPGLQQLYAKSAEWFNGQQGAQYYPGQTNAPSNWNIDNALAGGYNQASYNVGQIDRATNQLQSTAGGIDPKSNTAFWPMDDFTHGRNLGSNPALGTMSMFSNGGAGGMYAGEGIQNQLAGNSGQFGQVANGNDMGRNTANPYLQATADGSYLTDKTNPYLKGMFDNAAGAMTDQFRNAIAPAMASQFAAAGRSGSGAHQGAFTASTDSLGRSLGQAANNIYGGAYENERGRQQQAIGMMSQNYNTERQMQMQAAQAQLGAAQGLSGLNRDKYSLQLQGANSLAGVHNNERQQQLQAAQMQTSQYGMERGLQQQAQLAIPGMQQANFSNYDKMMGIGQYQQQQTQQGINSDRERWDFNQNAPLQRLQAYNQLLQGGAAYGGSSSSSNQTGPGRNPFASGLGGAAAASGLGSVMGGPMGAMLGGPWGMLGGALLGGLFG